MRVDEHKSLQYERCSLQKPATRNRVFVDPGYRFRLSTNSMLCLMFMADAGGEANYEALRRFRKNIGAVSTASNFLRDCCRRGFIVNQDFGVYALTGEGEMLVKDFQSQLSKLNLNYSTIPKTPLPADQINGVRSEAVL